MGFDINGVRFLFFAKRAGVDFTKAATLGRQQLTLSERELDSVLRDFEMPANAAKLLSEGAGYAEPLLSLLGAKEICSFDASSYEGATYVHDFNLPSPPEWNDRFTVFIDGGSLEHVLHYTVAVHNCMRMVQTQGHFLGLNPANNYFGHGFYQFNPELLYRVFSEKNGFAVRHLVVSEFRRPNWYEVMDPSRRGGRIYLINYRKTNLLLMAKRMGDIPASLATSQQSDYVQNWQAPKSANGKGPKSVLKRIVPEGLREMIRFYRRYYLWKWNTVSFRPLKYGRHQTAAAAFPEKSARQPVG
jgi:hypothetical protein